MKNFSLPVFLFIWFLTVPCSWAGSFADIDSHYASSRTFDDYQEILKILADRLETEPDSPGLTWRMARTLYALGDASESAEARLRFFQECAERAEGVTTTFPEMAEGHYFNALCLGKQGQVEGLLNGLFIVSRFREGMETAVRLDPNVESGGPHRALGRLYHDLPGVFGGDLEESIRHLKLAARIAPDFPHNHLFLAEALYENRQLREAERSLSAFFKTFPEKDDGKRGRELLQTIQEQLNSAHAQGTDNP